MASRPLARAAGTAEPIVLLRGHHETLPRSRYRQRRNFARRSTPGERSRAARRERRRQVDADLDSLRACSDPDTGARSEIRRPRDPNHELRGHRARRTASAPSISIRHWCRRLTVLENLMLGAFVARAHEADGDPRKRVSENSPNVARHRSAGGRAARLALARPAAARRNRKGALAGRPSVLILDEATSMLTPQGVEDLGRVIGAAA